MAPYPTPATAVPNPADVAARARALERVLPPEPNPIPFQIPEDAAPDELPGLHRFALALVLFSGVIVAGTLLALFLSLLRKHDFQDVRGRHHRSHRV